MLRFTYEMKKCIACQACQVACKDKNHLETGTFFRRVATFAHNGTFVHFSGGCHHCEDAACIKACQTQAMHRADDFTVAHDASKCISCHACVWSCPYGAVSISKKTDLAQKCNSCADLRASGSKPACVQACLTHCLDFQEAAVNVKTVNEYPEFLAPKTITKPKTMIIN